MICTLGKMEQGKARGVPCGERMGLPCGQRIGGGGIETNKGASHLGLVVIHSFTCIVVG